MPVKKVVLDAKAAGIQCMDAGLLNRDEEINNAYSRHATSSRFSIWPRRCHRTRNRATPTKFSSLQRQLLIGAERLVAGYEMRQGKSPVYS